MIRYRLVLLVSNEFIACTQETRTLSCETENKWTRIGEYNKVWDCFRHCVFFLTNDRPENTEQHFI